MAREFGRVGLLPSCPVLQVGHDRGPIHDVRRTEGDDLPVELTCPAVGGAIVDQEVPAVEGGDRPSLPAFSAIPHRTRDRTQERGWSRSTASIRPDAQP